MISDKQILKAIEKEDKKIKLENLIYSLPALISACASQTVQNSDLPDNHAFYQVNIMPFFQTEATKEQVDSLIHKIMNANVTLEGALTKQNDKLMSDGTSLLNSQEINGTEVSVREARYLTEQGVEDIVSITVSKEVNKELYAIFINVRRDSANNLIYNYSEYYDGKKQEIGEKQGINNIIHQALKTTIEAKDLENKVYADNPANANGEDLIGTKEEVLQKSREMTKGTIEIKTPEKPAENNYNKTDLTIAGTILAASLIGYTICRKLGYFGKKK